ncbi:MAG: glycosyltransferase family 39 protein [Polyangiaceae bacterium]
MSAPSPRSPLLAPIPWLARHAAVARVFLYAFLVRAVFDMVVQRPLEAARSDMGGYIGRALAMLDKPLEPDPMVTFFPYGTHMLLGVALRLFGRANFVAVALLFALLGATAAAATYATAKRLFPERPRLALAVGIFFTLYPTWVHLGAFVLSETPLSAAVALSTLLALRLLDEGRARDAWLLGATIAVGATFRPQLLVFVPMLFLAAIAARRRWFPRGGDTRRVSWAHASIAVLLPVALVLGASAARTEYHTKQFGLVSTNGAFNVAIGRCRAVQLSASKSRGGTFTPPAFNALSHYEEHYKTKPLIPLDPALGEHVSFDGYLWEEKPALELAKRCVATTGVPRQIGYSLGHVGLLWFYNTVWPTKGALATVTSIVHAIVVLPGLAIALVLLLVRRDPRLAVLGAQAAGLILTAMLVFGEARLRAPYDGVLDTLAVAGYLAVIPKIVARFRARRRAPAVAPAIPVENLLREERP